MYMYLDRFVNRFLHNYTSYVLLKYQQMHNYLSMHTYCTAFCGNTITDSVHTYNVIKDSNAALDAKIVFIRFPHAYILFRKIS